MYADDLKIYNIASSHFSLQGDLDTIMNWSEKWLLRLNILKCHVMHLGRSNPRCQYVIDDVELPSADEEVDLGVTISSDLKWHKHVDRITKNAHSLIYLTNRALQPMTTDMFIRIYKAYIRPRVEYAFTVWNPYHIGDIELLERVQRRATKLPGLIRRLPYETRLQKLGLTTLQLRRTRGDLIEVYKMLNNKYSCNLPFFTRVTDTGRRGHSMKLEHESSRLECKRHFFSLRVIGLWNRLPEQVVSAGSVNHFKNELDRVIQEIVSY